MLSFTEEPGRYQRVAHLAFWYDSEVQNGGHLQYFENQGVSLLSPTLEALSALGAGNQRHVLERAALLLSSKSRPEIKTVEQYVDVALKGEFQELDTEYHGCTPSIIDLLEEYLKRNTDQFIEAV